MTVYALHVGCNDLDESQYPPLDGPRGWHLPSSFAAADLIAGLTRDLYPVCVQAVLRNPTVGMVEAELDAIASVALAGDLVLFTYAGHGAQIPTDFNATDPAGRATVDEPNLQFEVAILLRDRMIIANEMRRQLRKFSSGVHFVAILDGCGIATFHLETEALSETVGATKSVNSPTKTRRGNRDVPTTVGADLYKQLYLEHKDVYDEFIPDPGPVSANGLLMSSTADGGTGYQMPDGSGALFTTAFCEAMRQESPPPTYADLRSTVEAKLLVVTRERGDDTMYPQLVTFGSAGDADKNRQPLT